MKRYILLIILFVLIVGCNPKRWEHVDIQQINSDGEVVQTWKDAKIVCTWGNGFLSGGMPGVRFETSDGKQVSLMTPHRFLYR